MRNLIKAALLLLFISLSIQSFSQIRFKAGVRAGLNIASISQNFSSNWNDFELKSPLPRILYSFGPCFDVDFSRFISLQPALLFSSKGVSRNTNKDYNDNSGYDKWTINYFEVPINVAIKLRGFQFYAGPYIAIALSGKNKWDYTDAGESYNGDEKLTFTNEVDPNDFTYDYEFFSYFYKRFDYGLNLGIGYKLGPVLINAGYSFGLANLTPSIKGVSTSDFDPADAKRSTRTFTFNVSYFFGRWR